MIEDYRLESHLMTKDKKDWKFIEDFDSTEYRCGARAGMKVRLLSDIVMEDHLGKPTGEINREGEVWTVMKGSSQDPGVIFLKRADGDTHTWNDDQTFWDQFEEVPLNVN